MASNFSDKQKWVACLEAAVKNIQRKDTIIRSVSNVVFKIHSSRGSKKETYITYKHIYLPLFNFQH